MGAPSRVLDPVMQCSHFFASSQRASLGHPNPLRPALEAQLTLLRKLQDFDLQIQEITHRTEAMKDSVEELQSIYEQLKEQLDAQKEQLDETRALMRDKEIELDENQDRYNQSKGKLNGVANTKQYNALEKEMDTLKKMRVQLEEERDTLRDNLAAFASDVEEKEKKTNEIAKQIERERAEIAKAEKDASTSVEKLKSSRQKIRNDIPKEMVRRYEFILSKRAGRAVVAAVAGVCTGCNMTTPPQLFNELQLGKRMIQCSNCQRILFYQSSEEAQAEA